MRYYVSIAFLFTVLALPWLIVNYPTQTDQFLSVARSIENQLASSILARSPKSVDEIKSRYTPTSKDKVRILLVPGHEPGNGGTQFGSLYERDLVLELTTNLEKFLKDNGRYEVITTRTAAGWNPVFEDYFKNSWDEIIAWQKEAKKEAAYLRSIGQAKQIVPLVYHNDAPLNVAYRLYGVTKWANENDIDIAIHIHFNDYPRRNKGVPGEHSGFSIYVPAADLGNSTTTAAIASTVFKRLARYNPVSNLPVESQGIVEEPELIAIGPHNTAAAASMLIEYGYIYESQFINKDVRSSALSDLAFQTYLGLQDFFGSGNDVTRSYDTLMLPRSFNRHMSKDGGRAEDIFALQTALTLEGTYPPRGKAKNDCPRTGRFGVCTQIAVENFQKKHGIYDEVGYVGTRTLNILNRLYAPSGSFNASSTQSRI